MLFTTEGLFEIAIESWPEWDLNPQPLNSTRTQNQLCTTTPISSFVQCLISFRLLPSSVATFILIEIFLR